ncbi:hypothetical protein CBS101457_001709 [Exobasidium rhododendri]|nr:hypothetical protein CBS101457_001709 [Exobasidium rhododendri]
MNSAHQFAKESQPKIDEIEKKFDDAQAEIIKYSNKLHEPIFKERDELLKGVEKFWTKALGNCMTAMIYIDDEDKPVFDYLNGIRVERSTTDPREATIHFDFEENKYFKDTTLTKAFKVKKDAEPLSAEFDFPRNVESSKTIIEWKGDDVNQSKLRPTKIDSEDEFEPGSFFSSFFEQDNDDFAAAIGDVLINDFYPRAIDYYTDKVSEDFEDDEEEFSDEEDEEDEEDNDDDREIDLEEEEKRASKKTKHN